MDPSFQQLSAWGDLLILIGAVVVLVIALYVFARSIAEGRGAMVGLKKMWSVIWKNTP
jgi:hypothetical protein